MSVYIKGMKMPKHCAACPRKREDASRCRDFIPKPTTTADRIRAMTDEELAEWYGTHACCMNDPFFCDKPGGSCKKCWLDWLKSPAEDAGP